ncbi:MAG: hypothetical protein QOI82_3205 [Actinomycetota bacterium]|jgi:hypothetical protein|nr:hypothetical protein [Actinomycetota bacterium]
MIGDRWGVTAAEVTRRYPCDDLVPNPVMHVWRGVTVEAPPRDIWPWLLQVRLAPYSYDWIDNVGRRSPRSLLGLADPRPGDRFTRVGERFEIGRVLSVAREEHLTANILGAVMSYVLVPEGASTRLLLKIVMGSGRWYAPALSVGDLVMARRQLLNFKALAEAGRDTAATT